MFAGTFGPPRCHSRAGAALWQEMAGTFRITAGLLVWVNDHVVSGGEFARRFHADIVAPLLARAMPGLGYAPGGLGSGSDVLGFDDAMSRDHDWGCRLTLLVDEADRGAVPQITGQHSGPLTRYWRRRLKAPRRSRQPGTALLSGQGWVEADKPHGVCLIEFGYRFPRLHEVGE